MTYLPVPGELVDPNPPATLAEGLARPTVYPQFCVELTCGLYAPSWQLLVFGPAYVCPLGDGTGIYNDSVDEVVGVKVNGVALAEAADLTACVNTAGTFFWDGEARQQVAIHLLGDANPRARGTIVMLTTMLRVSDGPTGAGGYRWRPWLLDVPTLTRQIAADFNGIPQIGGGVLTLQNETHYFDTRFNRNWDAGLVVLKMGVSGLDYADFVKLATFIPSSPELDDKNFILNVQDRRVLVDTFYPKVLFTRDAYPNIDEKAVGTVVPVAMGPILGVVPTCIDTVALEFMVAGHPITTFDGVRVYDQDLKVWVTVNFKSVDEQNARFTLDAADYTPGDDVVVDFSGWVNDDGSLMENPALMIQALLTDMQQPTDAAGFALAAAWYDYGSEGLGVQQRRLTVHVPSIYLNTQAKALTTLETVMVNIRAYLTINADGDFTMTPFRNYMGSTLPTITDTQIIGAGVKRDGSGTSNFRVQAGSKLSSMAVFFGIKTKEGIRQVVSYNSELNMFTRNSMTDDTATFDSLFTREEDAEYLAQALVNEYRVDPVFYKLDLKWLPFTWQPGIQHVHVVDARHGVDVVLEVIKVSLNLSKRTVSLLLGNLRGFDESTGFWVLSTDVTPEGAGLEWPQNGEAVALGETQYIRQQAGHWAGIDDFAVNTATPGNTWTALDLAPSRFQ